MRVGDEIPKISSIKDIVEIIKVNDMRNAGAVDLILLQLVKAIAMHNTIQFNIVLNGG